jgi:hypothetical protein
MKKVMLILLFSPGFVSGQVTIAPYIGLNSTRMTQDVGYKNGGNYAVMGAEVELSSKPNPYKVVHFSFVTGAGYLPNGFKTATSTQFTYYRDYYDSKATQIQTKYLQIPVLLRVNFRLFPLMEDWQLFLSGGIIVNRLTSAHMAEQWTYVLKPSVAPGYYAALFPAPVVTQAEDSRDVTSYANRSSLFERFEFGMKFRHFQVTYRYSLSMEDMYFKGIEKVWKVPADHSLYISAHNTRSVTKEKYSEIVFGWRIP